MKVLVVEDQVKLGPSIQRGLSEQGWKAKWVQTAGEAEKALGDERYDVVVLDLMLPDRDGLDALREWRRHTINIPVLILSARNAVKDRVQGLEIGADDYLAKPFSMEELVARVRALQRRPAAPLEMAMQHRDLVLNPARHTVALGGKPLELTAREFALLEIFLDNPGRLMIRSLLIERVWNVDYDVESNLLDVYMSRLRSKIEAGSAEPYFETVRGMGYRLI